MRKLFMENGNPVEGIVEHVEWKLGLYWGTFRGVFNNSFEIKH